MDSTASSPLTHPLLSPRPCAHKSNRAFLSPLSTFLRAFVISALSHPAAGSSSEFMTSSFLNSFYLLLSNLALLRCSYLRAAASLCAYHRSLSSTIPVRLCLRRPVSSFSFCPVPPPCSILPLRTITRTTALIPLPLVPTYPAARLSLCCALRDCSRNKT